MAVLILIEAFTPLTVLVFTSILLILNLLYVCDGDIKVIHVVSSKRYFLSKLRLTSTSLVQVLLATMSMSATRFIVVQMFCALARSNDDGLELRQQER